MKRSVKLILLLMLLAVSVLTAVSCGDSVDEITVSEDGMPQLVFVLGQELDLSNGQLTVKVDDEVRQIAMNSEGVTVSGYDKTKLGEQTVTVAYGKKSVDITVTVVERMVVTGAVTDYLVGEPIDLSKGSAKVTRNDGTSYSINLNNPKITATGFSSSAAGDGTVSVSYNNGSETYTASFGVKVYAVESVELASSPSKLSYNSHEEALLDLTGGAITVKGNGGALQKTLPMTESVVTVSGFDITAVNAQNTPYTQKITVSYGGKSMTYDVSLVYTDISKFLDSCQPFLALDWEGADLPEISDELGELALDLMESYLKLTKAQMSFISDEQTLAVARSAFIYGMVRIDDDLLALEDAFYLSGGGLVFACESKAAVSSAVTALSNKSSDLYTVSPVLSGIIDVLGDEDFDGNNFNAYAVINVEEYAVISDILKYALELSEKFDQIPADWQTQGGAATFGTTIEDVYGFMSRSGYYDAAYAQIYYAVSSWRGGDDIFDILYTYYFDADNMDVVVELASVALPTVLDELLSNIIAGMQKMSSMITYLDAYDTTEFLRYYYTAKNIAKQIVEGDDEMVKTLYNHLPLNTLIGLTEDGDATYYFDSMIEYLESGEGGVQYCAVAMFGIPEYHALLDKYMNIVIKLFEDADYAKTPEYGTAVEDMFATYLALSPARQYNFLSSLNPIFYGMYPELAFDARVSASEDYTCQFVQIIHDYYRGKFSDSAAAEAYNNLVIALEIYAQRSTYENWITEFSEKITAINTVYTAMSESDRAVFNQYFAALRSKCDAILIKHGGSMGGNVNLGDWKDEFDALNAALTNAGEAYQLFSEGLTAYSALLSAYERANIIVTKILADAPKSILDIFYDEDIFTINYVDSSGFGTSIKCSYDFAFHYYRSAYASALVSFGYADQAVNIYGEYNYLNMSEFMNKCYDVIWCYFNQTDYDRVTSLALIDAFSKLDIEQQILFMLMEGDGFYYTAINEFCKEEFTKAAASVAEKMFEIEKNYIFYMYYPNAESLQSLETALGELKTAYGALEGDDKTSFADLEAVYAHYVELCEDAVADAAN